LHPLPAAAQPTGTGTNPIVIAHRGASGERPEHTLAAYELAIDQGADYIEPDLVMTKDGGLIARHENEISGTTDIADHPEFASRRTTRLIDGQNVTGWFAEDFTLAELKTLRARERLPDLRRGNTQYDGQFEIATFAEIVALIRRKESETGRRIGLYPELKHPGYLEGIGYAPVDTLIASLKRAGYGGSDPVFIQSFEVTPLVQVKFRSDFKRVQLIAAQGGPADAPDLSYAQFIAPAGLAQVATYADAVGVDISLLIGPDGEPTGLVDDARAAGLDVHAWTLRAENAFLPTVLQRGDDPAAAGCPELLLIELRRMGVAGVFTDQPGRAVDFLKPGAAMPQCMVATPPAP
jgi:glycerophosphoryl diester phosphodiesterase